MQGALLGIRVRAGARLAANLDSTQQSGIECQAGRAQAECEECVPRGLNRYSENACLAAKQMTGRRFLASAAPKLPLPECTVAECHCSFTHHDDRRSGYDRRSPFGGTISDGTGTFEQERRATPNGARTPIETSC